MFAHQHRTDSLSCLFYQTISHVHRTRIDSGNFQRTTVVQTVALYTINWSLFLQLNFHGIAFYLYVSNAVVPVIPNLFVCFSLPFRPTLSTIEY